jgi:hypothetical protein
MNNTLLINWLLRHEACSPSLTWLAGRDLATAWAECGRGDWMLWLAARAGMDRRVVVAACCACARTLLPRIPADETLPLAAIEAVERWCRGEASIDEVRAARDSLRPLSLPGALNLPEGAQFAIYAIADACTATWTSASVGVFAGSAAKEAGEGAAPVIRSLIPLDVVLAAMNGVRA